jgi:hypothetical protein
MSVDYVNIINLLIMINLFLKLLELVYNVNHTKLISLKLFVPNVKISKTQKPFSLMSLLLHLIFSLKNLWEFVTLVLLDVKIVKDLIKIALNVNLDINIPILITLAKNAHFNNALNVKMPLILVANAFLDLDFTQMAFVKSVIIIVFSVMKIEKIALFVKMVSMM